MKKQIVSLVLIACLFGIFPLSAAAKADDVYFTEPRSTTAFRDEFLTFAKAHAIEHGYYYEPVFGENSYYYEELYHHYSGGSIDWALIQAQYALQEPHFIRTWIRLCNKTFDGDLVEYFPEQNQYVVIPGGGVVTSKDGTFTADHMEGWLGDEHYVGIGNAHLVSPPRDLEAWGDRVDYFGKEQGKAILTGHAWAIQENNTVRGNRLTIYLAKDGKAKVQ